jgi:hypothetical protein
MESPEYGSPLAACGRPGFLSYYWAGEGKVHMMSWGDHNAWTLSPAELPPDVDISPGTKLHAMCRAHEYNGVVWAAEGGVHHLYTDHAEWGYWKYEVFETAGMTKYTPLAAVGRPGYLSVWWAADGRIIRKHMGEHNGWEPQDEIMEPPVPILAGTPVYAFARSGEHDGVVWAGDGEIRQLYHDHQSWGEFQYSAIPTPGITPLTPLAACGRPGWLGVFWAGNAKIHLKHWGVHTGWVPIDAELPPVVEAMPGMLLSAMCRDHESNGVVWDLSGQTYHLYEDFLSWGEWKYESVTALLNAHVHEDKLPSLPPQRAVADPALTAALADFAFTPSAAAGRTGYLSMYMAGQERVLIRHWGAHSNWAVLDEQLAPTVGIAPGTPLYAMSRTDEYSGVVWASEGQLHHLYMDWTAWGDWKYDSWASPGVTPDTPLGACGRRGYLAVWWAGSEKVIRTHWGEHNGWVPESEMFTPFPIAPGTKVYALSRTDEYDGIVWAGDQVVHHFFQDSASWGTFRHEEIPQPGITPATPLAACGRPGWLGVFWAGSSQINLMHWGWHNGWVPETAPLGVEVESVPGMPLYAMCRDDGYNGVVFEGVGKIQHLYEDFTAFGTWQYEHLPPRGDSTARGTWQNLSDSGLALPLSLAAAALVALPLSLGLFRMTKRKKQ